MATAAFNQTITTNETVLFSHADSEVNPCTGFRVSVGSGSSNSLLVHVAQLHKSGEFAGIRAGESKLFIAGEGGLKKVIAKGDSGDATQVDYEIASRTGEPLV